MPTEEIRRRVNRRLEELYERHLRLRDDEDVRYYTPGAGHHEESTESEQERFAICLTTTDGEVFHAGDHDLAFALESISKVFVHGTALEAHGRERVLERVGVEPSGEPFYSTDFDERNNRPYDPMINAGALATTDLVESEDPEEDLERILNVLRRYAGNESLEVDEDVFAAEMESADLNRATSYLTRSYGMISHAVEENLALYLQQCSVHVACRDLAVMAATLANGGTNPATGEQALDPSYIRDVLSVMYTCGMYDFAGEWAYRVGIPARSGVSGSAIFCGPALRSAAGQARLASTAATVAWWER